MVNYDHDPPPFARNLQRGLVNPRFVQLELESERLRQQVCLVTGGVCVRLCVCAGALSA